MNWHKIAQQQFYYAMNCTDLEEGMPIQEMIDRSTKITWDEFSQHVAERATEQWSEANPLS